MEYGSLNWRRATTSETAGSKPPAGTRYYGDHSRMVLWVKSAHQLRLVSDIIMRGLEISRLAKPQVKIVPADGAMTQIRNTLPATKGRFTVIFKGGWSYVSAHVRCTPETYRTFIFQRMLELLGRALHLLEVKQPGKSRTSR